MNQKITTQIVGGQYFPKFRNKVITSHALNSNFGGAPNALRHLAIDPRMGH
jgi:hypothetical protein